MNNEKTHLIIGDRQVGKTTRLIKESYEKGIPIIVWCNDYAKNILNKAKEMNISLDAIVFPDTATTTVSKTVTDFFAGKSEAEIQKYISLCQQADAFKTDK